MEVDEPLVCFQCLNPILRECDCTSDDVASWILKCTLCNSAIRIYQKVLPTPNFHHIQNVTKTCLPSKIIYSYDIEENVYRFEYRRLHYY